MDSAASSVPWSCAVTETNPNGKFVAERMDNRGKKQLKFSSTKTLGTWWGEKTYNLLILSCIQVFKLVVDQKLFFPSPVGVWEHAGAVRGLLEPGFSWTSPSHPTSLYEHTVADWLSWGWWEFGVLSGFGYSSSGRGGKHSWLGDTLRVSFGLVTQREPVYYLFIQVSSSPLIWLVKRLSKNADILWKFMGMGRFTVFITLLVT